MTFLFKQATFYCAVHLRKKKGFFNFFILKNKLLHFSAAAPLRLLAIRFQISFAFI